MLCILLCVLIRVPAQAEGNPSEDKTLSPYFFVSSGDPAIDRMPLKSTSANVTITGVIADVTVSQVYKNEGKKTLEAVYVFPASTRAAVYGMKMTIGKRIIEAKIEKREEARKKYEQAKSEGKSASLLEQQRPNVFQMNVANILPGDTIAVELRYTELMVPTDKTYEFVYPTVVGPRYTNQPAAVAPAPEPPIPEPPINEQWVENPHLPQGEAPTYTFDIKVNIAAGLPIQQLFCSSHKVRVDYEGPALAAVSLDRTEAQGGNRDYILKYQLAGSRIESGLLLSDNGKEKFFLLMLQPPKKVVLSQLPGREYIFIVDVSGSMHGFPLDISKRLFRDLITNLRPADRFNVLLFSGGSAVLSEESLDATEENIKKATSFIDRQQGGGGTELLPALKRALSLPQTKGFSRTVVIATDGYVTVEEQVFDLIRNNLNKANMFTFGIGTSVNRHLLEGMARVGMGEPFVITKAGEAPARAAAFRTMIQSPLLTHITVDYKGFDAYDIEPITIPDVLADRPVLVFGKWRGRPAGSITVKGISGSGAFRETIDLAKVSPTKNNTALRYLWARHRIALLSDYNSLKSNDKRIQEVTQLGLDYNLLTAYTSFVAVDNQVRNKQGALTTVRQPLPLPEGVSDYAVGGRHMASPAMTMPMRKSVGNTAAGPQPLQAQENMQKKEEAKSKDASKDLGTRQTIVDEISVPSGMGEDAVRKIVEQHYQELLSCLGKAQVVGKISVNVSVDAKGAIRSVRVISTTLKDKNVVQCMLKQIKKWNFGPTAKARKAAIKFTLIF
jgi:Ca-activated chloride channel family protein